MNGYLVSRLSHYCNISLPQCMKLSKRIVPYYDFTFVTEGSMTYIVDGHTYLLNKNDAVFIRPGSTRIREQSNTPVSYVSFNFELFSDVALPFPTFMQDCITPTIRKQIALYPTAHLSSLSHSGEKCLVMLNYILYELLNDNMSGSENEHIAQILAYVDEHIHEKLSLKDISLQLNLTREYTSYLFKKEMHKTLTEYIHERKLLIARELILSNEMTLTDLAVHLGFEDYNYFYRLFKKYFEITPTELKKRVGQDGGRQ